MQEGLGAVVIDRIIDHIKTQVVRACICKRTADVLVLQFNVGDEVGYNSVHDFIYTFQVEFTVDIDGTVERINMYIGQERIVTVTMDSGGIQVFEVDEKTGLLVRPAGASSANVPRLSLPSADYLESYREASREFYAMSIRGFTPDPKDNQLWKTLIETLRDMDHGENLAEGAVQTYTYWLIHDEEYIGSVRIRQRLTPALYSSLGCCYNFEVRPSMWRRGYAKVLVALSYQKAVSRGVDMILCGLEKSNIPAIKAIEKNGAMKFTETKDELRYWLPAVLRKDEEVDFSRFL